MSNSARSQNKGGHKVRIIGGSLRRRLISFPESEGLRPSPDRVRETLFNWLGQELTGQLCLDAFAGSGALGFEAASRGAKAVFMLEASRIAVAALKDNQKQLTAHTVQVVQTDALAWMRQAKVPFDTIFLDPPFASDLLPKALTLIQQQGLLTATGYIYIETGLWPEPEQLSGWDEVKQAKAGHVHYGLLRLAAAAP